MPKAAFPRNIISNVQKASGYTKPLAFLRLGTKELPWGCHKPLKCAGFGSAGFSIPKKWAEGFTKSAYRPYTDGSGVLKRDDRETQCDHGPANNDMTFAGFLNGG